MNQRILEGSFSTKCLAWAGAPNAKVTGAGGLAVGPWWFLSYFSRPVTSPPHPPARRRHEYSCDRCHMAPFVLIFGREVKGLKVCGTETRSGGIFTMPSCAERLDRLSQGAPSCVPGSEMSPWGCEEACSSGEVTAFLPTLPVPRPHSGQPVRRAGGKARVARAARAGQPFSRSQSRNPLLKRKQRGGLAGVSWLVVPRSRLWRSTARPRTGWSPDSGPSCS